MKRRYRYTFALLLCVLAGCGGNSWSSGDRVLVAKFLYDSQISQPRRFDVVVFKYPDEPVKNGVPKNYIKRLLGLPGELIAIFFGRLFHCPPPPADQEGDVNDPYNIIRWERQYDPGDINPLDLWKSSNFKHNDELALELWQKRAVLTRKDKATGKIVPAVEIIRKPLDNMMALRRPVFNNDNQAADLNGIVPPRWAAFGNTAWAADDTGKSFHHAEPGASLNWLRYRHILRPTDWPEKNSPDYQSLLDKDFKVRNYQPQLITDFMGYNTAELANKSPKHNHVTMPLSCNWVGDLMLECQLTVEKAEGEFRIELSKGVDRFQARWDLKSGTCALFRIRQHGKIEEKLDEQATGLSAPGEYQLRFANIDERLTVWVNRELPFGDGKEYAPPEKYGPDDEEDVSKNNDLQPASVGALGAAVKVRQLVLWRDTYYTGSGGPDAAQMGSMQDWSDPKKWDHLRNLGVRTYYVYPGHYFCLGDNSPQSYDGRNWGLVPERLMLGRALLVYYPFDRAGRIK
jgi:signal peptidase I